MAGRESFVQRLHGRGLDIGPLHRPMVTHPDMKMEYIDRFPVEKLREHYPELAEHELAGPLFIDDAETLARTNNGRYDFVVAAHVIEHMRNPLLAIKNWLRVMAEKRFLYLVVPDYRAIFDRDRPLTTLEHIVMDYKEPSTERDWQHYKEYARLVDKAPDVAAHAFDLLNRDYSIHFHTFTPESMVRMLNYFDERVEPITIVRGPEYDQGDKHEFNILIRKEK